MTVLHIVGVPIRLHPLFVLLVVGWLAFTAATEGRGAVATWSVLLGMFVGSVLVHELGHVLAGRRYGIRTRAIVLHPLGGAAELETRQVPPRVDVVVSVAGPAANLAIAGPALLGAYLTQSWLLAWVGAINLLLGVLNLVPAFPMDGGRILRAVLVAWAGAEVGNRVALGVGFAFAVALGATGLAFLEPGLVVLAAFMILLQWREHRVQAWLRQHPEWA